MVAYHLANGGVSRFEKFKYYHEEFLNISLDEGGIQELAKKFSKLVIDKVVNAPYIPGAFEFISNNYKKYDMFISTATPTEEIIEILNQKKLTKYFKGIKGSPESKIDHAQQIISENNYLRNETVFIGDSNSDRTAAIENNLHFIYISNDEKKSFKESTALNLKKITLMLDTIINSPNKLK